MKTCFKCLQSLSLNNFYRHPKMKDGVLGKCKECAKKDVKLHRRLHDHVREYDRKRSKEPKKAASIRATSDLWSKNNPAAKRAQTALNNAVRDKKIKKLSCLFCGEGRVHGHHRDYSRPLDIIWLCAKCHHRLHANFPETSGHA